MNIQKKNKQVLYIVCGIGYDDLVGADYEDLSLEDADRIRKWDDETGEEDQPMDDRIMETGQSVSVTSHSTLHRLQHRLHYLA
jgi:hypothetical protein